MFCQLAHVNGAQLVYLGRHRILLDHGFFSEGKLQRIIRRQRDIKTLFEIADERVAVVGEEQCVIAQRRHRNPDLFQVEDILEQWHLSEGDAVTDAVAAQQRRRQMICITSLATVRPEKKRVESSFLSPHVERGHIGEEVIYPVGIWRILFCVPLFGGRELPIQPPLHLALVVDAIEADYSLEEYVEFRMRGWITGDFEEWLKDIVKKFLESLHGLERFVQSEETRDLDQPPDIVREKLVVNHPGGQSVPLFDTAAVDADPPFNLWSMSAADVKNLWNKHTI